MSRVHPLRAAGLGALAGLGLAYPVAQHYTSAGSAGSATTVTVTSGQGGARPSPSAAAGPASGTAPATPPRQVLKATGSTVQTRYGPVQVRVTLVSTGGTDRIRSVTALQLPSGGESGQISSYAGPRLGQEAVAAQGAKVDTVSGASYTSDGYRRSLQAALDAIRTAEKSSS
jgi:uncharacterized protein with FMN-binding domain